MEAITQKIKVDYCDPRINEMLTRLGPSSVPYSIHFNQHEEFFLKLYQDFEVYALPIHHDVNETRPTPAYQNSLQAILQQLCTIIPELFQATTYYFDPADILRPAFFRTLTLYEQPYLYLLQLDFNHHFQEGQLVTKGNNDLTPHYRTQHLYLEAALLPLADIQKTGEQAYQFTIRQILADTWIGEEGRGYFAKGIWIDSELTKFFSKLFLLPGQKHYPYYPFLCRYKTIALALIQFSEQAIRRALPYLHNALQFLTPEIQAIQQALKNQPFNEGLEIFGKLRERLDTGWTDFLTTFKIDTYLNQEGMKEFRIDI